MRERINRLAKGIIDAETPVLCITPEEIEEAVPADELTGRELYIADAEGRFVKGLVYSSNIRVRVRNQAFGGNRNHISYEVDSRHLTREDVISGAFYLVTNGGEKKIPYSFSIELGVSKRTLEGLKTPADFAEIARKDTDMALRLFEYQDFPDAPFMQDMHIRTLYDGLKGRANRCNLLEEFLVALHAKEPVELRTDLTTRQYEGVSRLSKDFLEIKASTWGYVEFQVSADGEFIELPSRTFTSEDFQDGSCQVPFLINPARLHKGRNLGRLTLSTVRASFDVCIEVQVGEEELAGVRSSSQAEFAKYLELRLEYELGLYERTLLLNQMKQQLDHLREKQGENRFNTILQAEVCLMDGELERATAYLESIRHEVMQQRLDDKEWYCFYLYLQCLISEKQSQKAALIRLIQKLLYEEKGSALLYLLLLKLEPAEWENPAGVLEELELQFAEGCRSPFLYEAGLRAYKKQPKLLKTMSGFAMQVLVFAAKRGVLDRELGLRAAELSGLVKHFKKLHCRLLIGLYEQYRDKEFLSAVCAMLIKGDCRGSAYFTWYEKALQEGVSLTRLYEYFLYSLPKDYPYLLPKEVLLYFSYDKSLDEDSRSVLYANILKYMSQENPLYKQYERDMEQFAMEQLLQSRINRRLVVLYEHMLYKEMIDARVAEVLPSILKSYRVVLRNSNMKYVVVVCEELDKEDAFPIRDGAAYVPLFPEQAVLLFQDSYGNRYANIPHHKLPVMDSDAGQLKELEERCYDICPNHPMLRLQECAEIVEHGVVNDADLLVLKRALTELPLRPLYRKRMLSQMIRYYISRAASEDGKTLKDADFLMDLELERLSREERIGVCETLISQNYYREAYEIVRSYGAEGMHGKQLLRLTESMVLNQLFDENDLLLGLSAQLFAQGFYDGAVLDYMCEHWNGSTELMYQLLSCGEREHVEVYDLPERLLAQMMFTGETEHLDRVFDWYAPKKRKSDSIVRAYFTMKSADYFLKECPTGERIFSYLETAVQGIEGKHRIPTIYLLALTKYYSTLAALSENQQRLCADMVEILLDEGRVFAYFHELGKLIPMPDSVMDRVILEYRGGRQSLPQLKLRILPEEKDYSCEELRKVYPGIFVRQKVLFEGETLEYFIYDMKDGERVLAAEGSLSGAKENKAREGSQFTALSEMGLCFSNQEEDKLKEKMKKYLTDRAMMEELFSLI